MDGHNSNVTAPRKLTLSEVPRSIRDGSGIDRYGSPIPRPCRRCGNPIPDGSRRDARYCGAACRQAAFRRRAATGVGDELAPLSVDPGAVDGPAQNRDSLRARRTAPIAARSSAVLVEIPAHVHSPRLCAPCMQARFLELRAAPRARVSPALVAERIAADRGHVWGAVNAFDISYRHALAIRAGWRGAGRRAAAIPYSAGGWTNGRRHGWRGDRLDRLRVIVGGRRDRLELVSGSAS